MVRKERITDSFSAGAGVRPILVGAAIGAIVCIVILLALSFVISTQTVPQAMVSPMAIFAVSAGSCAAGFCCAKITRTRGLAYGAACGAVMVLLVMLASFSVSDNAFGTLALIKILFIMLSAMLGGVLGVNTRKRRR